MGIEWKNNNLMSSFFSVFLLYLQEKAIDVDEKRRNIVIDYNYIFFQK